MILIEVSAEVEALKAVGVDWWRLWELKDLKKSFS